MKLRSAAVFCASFLVVLAIVIGVSARRADSYTFTAIDVPGATVTVVSGINDRGEVVGWYRTGSSGDPDSADHGFLLAHGHFTTIDVPGSRGTVAEGINNRGEIVGYYFDQAAAQRGFLLLRGVFTTIECGAFTEPRGINDRGDIVGRLENHGFLFSKGKCTTIDFPGASFSSAFGVNNAGQVVGFYSDATGRHGFLLVHGAFTTIDPPQSVATEAIGINDHDDIVGSYEGSGGHHGFVFSNGQFTNVDVSFPGAFFTNIFGINNSGEIAGEYDLTFERGFPPHGFVATP